MRTIIFLTGTVEFTAMTRSRLGRTEAVTIRATSADDARARLLAAGFHSVLWVV